MLRNSSLSAISRVGKVSQRSFCLGAVSRKDVEPTGSKATPAGQDEPVDMTSYTYSTITQDLKDQYYPHIGNRDIVGPSYSNSYDYSDEVDYTMPSLRWAPNTSEVLSLRAKEMGDWKALSLEEKKQLYRNAYRQTLAEVTAPTGEWKRVSYLFLYLCAVATVYFVYYTEYCCKPTRTLNKEYQQEIVASMLMKNTGHFSGVSSKYDFEKNEWKK